MQIHSARPALPALAGLGQVVYFNHCDYYYCGKVIELPIMPIIDIVSDFTLFAAHHEYSHSFR